MIKLAHIDGVDFIHLEKSYELDKIRFATFEYFRKILGMADYVGNFKSWLERSDVFLLVAIEKNTIIGWVMNERWETNAGNDDPIFVLRAIEVTPDITRSGIGKKLFNVVVQTLPGYIIVKPVNDTAKAFFSSLGFRQTGKGSVIDLSDHPGYFALPSKTKKHHKERIPNGLNLCGDAIDKSFINYVDAEKVVSETVKRTKAKEHVITEKIEAGDHKMMSACQCGEFYTKKYRIKGDRNGIIFICRNCEKERYFMPEIGNQ